MRYDAPDTPFDVSTLVHRAKHGDESAWNALVDQYSALLWWMVRRFRLSEEQGADVVQSTWLTLVTKIGEIRDPERLSAWLLTTTRRRCIDLVNAAGREEPLERDDQELCLDDGPEDHAIRGEERAIVRAALDRLPARHRMLLILLSASPPISYQEIGQRMGMAVGSIGAARARALQRLRNELETEHLADAG